MTQTQSKSVNTPEYVDPRNRVCPVWIAKTFNIPIRKLWQNPLKMFSGYVKPGMNALDLGCGMGFFSLGMATLLKGKGKVYSVDIQQGMLTGVMEQAQRKGLAESIVPILCQPNSICVEPGIDFALTFWMLHETPDIGQTLAMIYRVLNQKGRLYIAEPRFHVTKEEFEITVSKAEKLGFIIECRPRVSMSYAAILLKPRNF